MCHARDLTDEQWKTLIRYPKNQGDGMMAEGLALEKRTSVMNGILWVQPVRLGRTSATGTPPLSRHVTGRFQQ